MNSVNSYKIISKKMTEQYDIDSKLYKVEIDIDELLNRIDKVNKEIDEIELGYLERNSFNQEFQSHLKQRKETLIQRKVEYRSDLETYRIKGIIIIIIITVIIIILSLSSPSLPRATAIGVESGESICNITKGNITFNPIY